MAGVLLVMTAAFLPETLRKTKQVQSIEKKMEQDHIVDNTKETAPAATVVKSPSFFSTLATSFKPMITMLHDPTVLVLIAYNTIIFACLYFLVK
jgi:hypothetical protein